MPLKTPVQAFYFSVVTMATVGYGDFVPTDDFSRLLVVFQLATGLVFVLAVAPAVLSLLGNRLQAK
jgi:voltage-gated potassium channel